MPIFYGEAERWWIWMGEEELGRVEGRNNQNIFHEKNLFSIKNEKKEIFHKENQKIY